MNLSLGHRISIQFLVIVPCKEYHTGLMNGYASDLFRRSSCQIGNCTPEVALNQYSRSSTQSRIESHFTSKRVSTVHIILLLNSM